MNEDSSSMLSRSAYKRLRRRRKRETQRRLRLRIETKETAQNSLDREDSSDFDNDDLEMPSATADSHPSPSPTSQSLASPCNKGFLDLPEEIRQNVYRFLQRPPTLSLQFSNVRLTLKRARCVSSTEYPMLDTCSIIRKEYLTHLLSITQLTLAEGYRPRVRHDPRQHGFPLWQLCRIQHVSIDTSYKMQFDFFRKLKTLTLIWPGKTLEVLVTRAWKKKSGGFLWSQEGAAAIVALGRSQMLESKERWIQKLATRKKKRFQLQMRAVFGFRDHLGMKGNTLVIAIIDVDHSKVVEIKSEVDPSHTIAWWSQ